MPFIGTQPEVGGYSVLDNLTASATANYTLQLNSANFVPSSANQLLVSLNGVIQKPGSSFTVSGSTLTFKSGGSDQALTSSDSIDFIISMGQPLNIGVPSDGTVTNSKITAMAASKLTGALPALDGSSLTGILSIGVGQTWTDTTSSRAFNTNYTNSTGRAIMVSFICTTGTGDNIQVNVGGLSFGDEYTNQSNGREMSSFIVPDNTVYRINGNTGSTTPVLQKWVELR